MSDTASAFYAKVEIADLAGVVALVREFRLEESLSAPYRAVVEIEADEGFDAASLRGGDLGLSFGRPGTERRLLGVITEVEEGRGEHEGSISRLRVEPALASLGLVKRTRIFQEKDAPTILKEVLDEGLGAYGREARQSLDGSYATREYCVQYQETDLELVHRLMEEEGIAYSFDFEGEKEVLVLTDANSAFERAPGAEEPLTLQPHDMVVTDDDKQPIHRFTRGHASTTTSVALRDFDWTSATYTVEAEERSEDAQGQDRESYEHGWGRSAQIWSYDAGARRYQEHSGAAQAKIRKESYLSGALIGRGTGRVVGLRPGTTFELTGHPAVGLDGEYLVTRVVHTNVSAESELGGGATRESYHNEFECIPLSVEYRPPRGARKPRIPSIQTAVVTGPSGEEIHTDEHGRIKVQFHWDRDGKLDEKSSCWVRVQQKWAGAGWGFWWLPRIGMEVVVQFIDGDPDRPLVTGSVYNAANGTPYPLPDEKTKSTIKSNSTPGGGGSNELRFEDKAGSEEIYAHAQKDYNEVVENDHDTLVHGNQTNEVDGNQTQTIHGKQEERVDGNQDMSVGGDRSVHAESNFDETVDGTETRHVSGDVSETFAASETRTVGANLDETIGASETRTIGADQSETISGSLTQTIGGASTVTVSGAATNTITGGVTLTTPAAWDVTATAGMNITAPAGFKLNAAGGLQVAAPGGVQQVDFFRELMASLVHAKGGSIRAATGMKNEYIAVHLSAVGMTGSIGGGHVCVGIKLSNEDFKDRKGAVESQANGVAAETATADSK
jgi:type VI secretion system secreted protein VgrG